jgi:hypothetical protein
MGSLLNQSTSLGIVAVSRTNVKIFSDVGLLRAMTTYVLSACFSFCESICGKPIMHEAICIAAVTFSFINDRLHVED